MTYDVRCSLTKPFLPGIMDVTKKMQNIVTDYIDISEQCRSGTTVMLGKNR